MSGCYGNEGAFYYLDVFVNTAPHRLARPNKDYANYYAKDYADFGLPKGSDLRMWATPQSTVKVRSPNGRPNLARLLKGIKDLAAREHVVHQLYPPVCLRDDAGAQRGDLASSAPLQVEDGHEECQAGQRRHARHVEA